jgi:hypothetical protein
MSLVVAQVRAARGATTIATSVGRRPSRPLDTCETAGAGVDAAHVGRASARRRVDALYGREPPAPARLAEGRSVGEVCADTTAASEGKAAHALIGAGGNSALRSRGPQDSVAGVAPRLHGCSSVRAALFPTSAPRRCRRESSFCTCSSFAQNFLVLSCPCSSRRSCGDSASPCGAIANRRACRTNFDTSACKARNACRSFTFLTMLDANAQESSPLSKPSSTSSRAFEQASIVQSASAVMFSDPYRPLSRRYSPSRPSLHQATRH